MTLAREEFSGVGLYVLFGESESSGLPLAYIGEAEDCGARIKQHNKGKDFWNIAVAFVSRTGSFTKAHGRLLEWLVIDQATRAGRYQLENGNSGGRPNVPEWMRSDVTEVFETVEVLMSTLGFPLLEPPADHVSDEQGVFYCRRSGSNARGVYNEEGFVVLKDSIARKETTSSSHDIIQPKREELIGSGVLVSTSDGYRFDRDTVFTSPSAAASMVTGGSANGWVEWKNASGRTLDEVYRSASDQDA